MKVGKCTSQTSEANAGAVVCNLQQGEKEEEVEKGGEALKWRILACLFVCLYLN